MVAIRLERVSMAYGDVVAVRDVTLDVRPGELLTLLGASGSGKTTILRLIAGFLEPTGGAIWIRDRPMRGIPPYRRNIGIVFQHYGLFSHMRVFDNVAFGLRMRRLPRAVIRERVASALALVDLQGLERRYPQHLSGGQQQRVALARVLVIEPEVLLLDEPFGALDKKLREHMQEEFRRLQRRLGITTVFVTHDQDEALRLADRVAVIHGGRLIQVADPVSIYEAPADPFIARFIGTANFLPGKVKGTPEDAVEVTLEGGIPCLVARSSGIWTAGQAVQVVVRPEKVVLGLKPAADAPNVFQGVIEELVYFGVSTQYLLRLPSALCLTALVQNTADAVEKPLAVGDTTQIHLPPEHLHLFST